MLPRPLLMCALAAVALLAGCKETLLSKVTEPQANEVLAALSEARIDASKESIDETHWQVKVDDAKVGQALVFLRNRGLPSQPSATMGEVFKKDGMISSATEERARYAFALQEDIAGTLRRIEGVVDARVHVAIPHADPLATRVTPVSASVFIKYRPALDIDLMAPNIKSMVMSSVEGLDFRNITLVALPAVRDAAADAPAPPQRGGGMFAAHAAAREFPAQEPAPQIASPAGSAASVELLGAAMAGLCLTGAAAWCLRHNGAAAWLRRARLAASGGPRTDAGADDVVVLVKSAAATSRERAHARAHAPCAQPGLFAGTKPRER